LLKPQHAVSPGLAARRAQGPTQLEIITSRTLVGCRGEQSSPSPPPKEDVVNGER
jgi:hypothetical protein